MRMPPTSHRFECPVAQGGHFPQAGTKPSTTWSPGARPVTPGPTSSTTPAPSWPPMTGRGTGMSPVSRCSSEWHMPDAASLMRTSPSLGGSSSMGSTLQASRSHRTAASVCTVPPRIRRDDGSRYRASCRRGGRSARDPRRRRAASAGWADDPVGRDRPRRNALARGRRGVRGNEGGDPGAGASGYPAPCRNRAPILVGGALPPTGRSGPPGRAAQRCTRPGQGR